MVTVTASSTGTANVLKALQAASCIGGPAISTVLNDELELAQGLANDRLTGLAVDTYGAMLVELQALIATKSIASNCTIAGLGFNPANVLIADVRDLMGNLKVGTAANPVTGYVVDSNGIGLPNVTVSLVNSANTVVATTKTDLTGFYFFPTTGTLAAGSTYAIKPTGFPLHFTVSTPPSQTFSWTGSGFELANFVLN